jgi:hypothetical protein
MRTILSLVLAAMPLVGADVYASLNGVQRAEIWPGMPVFVEGFAARDEAMRVEVRDEKGAVVGWPWKLVAAEGKRGAWIVEGLDTGDWRPGVYRVRVVGSAASTDCTLRVVSRPGVPEEMGLRRELKWKVFELRRRGDVEGALRVVDEWLAGRAEDAVGLALRGELLAEAGRLVDAVEAFRVAIEREEAVRKEMGSKEPAGELRRQRDVVLAQLLGRAK